MPKSWPFRDTQTMVTKTEGVRDRENGMRGRESCCKCQTKGGLTLNKLRRQSLLLQGSLFHKEKKTTENRFRLLENFQVI